MLWCQQAIFKNHHNLYAPRLAQATRPRGGQEKHKSGGKKISNSPARQRGQRIAITATSPDVLGVIHYAENEPLLD